MAAVVKGHPGEALITLYPSLVDADVANFTKVLRALKWSVRDADTQRCTAESRSLQQHELA